MPGKKFDIVFHLAACNHVGNSVPLHGRSILYHKLSDAIRQGYDDFILAVGDKADMIVEGCRAMPLDCRYQISDAGVEAGMLHRIAAAREACGERVIVTYGDTLCNCRWLPKSAGS